MRVLFRLNERQLDLDVNEDWSILFLKQRVCLDFGCDPHLHFLLHDGIQLNDWDKISQLEIFRLPRPLIYVLLHKNINHFYVLCYKCDNVTPALLKPRCSGCSSSNFTVAPNGVSAEIRRISGMCEDCKYTEAVVEFVCSKSVNHSPTIFLKQVHKNLSLDLCIACCENTCEIMVTFCENLGHALCIECFRAYSESYLSDARFEMVLDIGLTLRCPVGCPNSCITETHLFRVLGKEFYSRYKEIAAKRACYSEEFCVCPQCGAFWEIPEESERLPWVVCEEPYGCGIEFCVRCHSEVTSSGPGPSRCTCRSHGAQPDPSAASGLSQAGLSSVWTGVKVDSNDLASRCLIAVTCKSCPCCKSQTNKDGGCNHVHCSVCGFEWCWICLKQWGDGCQSAHWF